MNSFKTFGFIGVAVAGLLLAGQAFACPTAPATGIATQGGPICIAPSGQDGPTSGLQNTLNGITKSGTPQIDVYNGQYQPSTWWSIGGTTGSENLLMFEIAGNAPTNTFGIYDPSNAGNYLQLFNGAATPGFSTKLGQIGNVYTATYFNATGVYISQASITINGGLFGYYLGAASTTPTFFSNVAANTDPGDTYYPNGTPHMVTYKGNDQTKLWTQGAYHTFLSGEYILGWEDQPYTKSDLDYQDLVVMVESVQAVPEPAVLGMFGLGLLLLGGAVAFRRRREGEAV